LKEAAMRDEHYHERAVYRWRIGCPKHLGWVVYDPADDRVVKCFGSQEEAERWLERRRIEQERAW
jgi:hypothetical protein